MRHILTAHCKPVVNYVFTKAFLILGHIIILMSAIHSVDINSTYIGIYYPLIFCVWSDYGACCHKIG